MSSKLRSSLATAALLAFAGGGLAGCGFTPLYADDGSDSVSTKLATVAIGYIPDRTGQVLHQALETKMYTNGTPSVQLYQLNVSYIVIQQGIGIQSDTSVTRNRYIATAGWTLASVGSPTTAKPLVKGTASTEDAENVIDQQYFAASLESDTVYAQLADQISSQITSQLGAYFKTHPNA